ncbi:recombinase family protein [Candidatus Peregrinibacteria bacterium]|nr:recombinase family protein [Candidatus Peregrinibacteria bacterium]
MPTIPEMQRDSQEQPTRDAAPSAARSLSCANRKLFCYHDAMKYVLYARKSSESEERQALSIEAQIAELREFAAKERLEIVASFEEAKTAKEPGRTVFGEMLDTLVREEAEGILAWHPDRLARNSVDGGRIIHMLDTAKLKDLKFPTMTFENTPQGKFMLSIAFSQSKYYVDNLSENVKRGIRQKLRRGEWPTLAPVGYINNPKTRNIQHDSEKAPLVRKAFELYATGDHTLYSLRQALADMGLRNVSGKLLPVSGIQKLLQNHNSRGVFPRMLRANRQERPVRRGAAGDGRQSEEAAQEKTRIPLHRLHALRFVWLCDYSGEAERPSLLSLHQKEGAMRREEVSAGRVTA